MTPEDVLEKHNLINGFAVEAFTERVVAAMEEYAGELKAQNEKMREVLEKIIDRCERGIYDATDAAFIEETARQAPTP
jgi:hypothetical protein